ncbi:cytochrome P450 [Streptomyces sp. RB6PN25]|uniref:Cytochrome P450 n=1 Tax=Streptomyces humicola TaxID=2953240 RepID=A0ABT1PNE6_9ACTN|nr:cytochrome P450 [Streptomyces humicola]MCQ4079196.1 cytochrome P450 [Streptomyces humicola]
MTSTSSAAQNTRVPDDIAQAVVLPESYGNETEITYPAFAWLRQNMPVGQAFVEGYDPLWLITKFDDIMTVEKNHSLFNATMNNPILNTQAGDTFLRSLTPDGSIRYLDALPFLDPPEHTQIKAATSNWFTPKNVAKYTERIREIAREDVEKLLSYDGECDWAADFALYYPLRVILGLFGIPQEDLGLMLKLTQDFFGANDPDEKRDDIEVSPEAAARQFQAAFADFFAYFDQFTEDRRANPKDDLMSVIANAKVDGEFLSRGIVNGSYLQVATAGHDTTSSTISAAALAMARNPDQWQKVREDHSLIPKMVDEAVRWGSPVKHFMRSASEDTVLHGVQIKKGERVMLNYPSGNRDEDYFTNANEFDLERSPNKHLGFGFGGHMCIGQHIARLEMNILFEELLPKIRKIELVGEPKPIKTNFVSSYKSLPVRFTKA